MCGQQIKFRVDIDGSDFKMEAKPLCGLGAKVTTHVWGEATARGHCQNVCQETCATSAQGAKLHCGATGCRFPQVKLFLGSQAITFFWNESDRLALTQPALPPLNPSSIPLLH